MNKKTKHDDRLIICGVGSSALPLDADGKQVFLGDYIKQTNFNGEPYEALYEVVIDPEDGEFAFNMIKGNKKAMTNRGLSAIPRLKNGRLTKGRLVNK